MFFDTYIMSSRWAYEWEEPPPCCQHEWWGGHDQSVGVWVSNEQMDYRIEFWDTLMVNVMLYFSPGQSVWTSMTNTVSLLSWWLHRKALPGKTLQSSPSNGIMTPLCLKPFLWTWIFFRLVHKLVEHDADVNMKNGSGKDRCANTYSIMYLAFAYRLPLYLLTFTVQTLWVNEQ